MSKKMAKASTNFTNELKQGLHFFKGEQADMCFVMAIKLFKEGQEELAAKFMARALSSNTDYEDYGMPIEEIGV